MADPTPIRIGDVWKERDKRVALVECRIAAIEGDYVRIDRWSNPKIKPTRVKIANLRSRWTFIRSGDANE